MKKLFYFLVGAIVLAMLASIFLTDNIHSIEGNFKELSFVRNKNNTGPVQRLYAYQVEDTVWSSIQQHADLLPHTKYGTTEVYYFLPRRNSVQNIELNLMDSKRSSFDKRNCIAYVKINGMGKLQLDKFPFKSF